MIGARVDLFTLLLFNRAGVGVLRGWGRAGVWTRDSSALTYFTCPEGCPWKVFLTGWTSMATFSFSSLFCCCYRSWEWYIIRDLWLFFPNFPSPYCSSISVYKRPTCCPQGRPILVSIRCFWCIQNTSSVHMNCCSPWCRGRIQAGHWGNNWHPVSAFNRVPSLYASGNILTVLVCPADGSGIRQTWVQICTLNSLAVWSGAS